MSELFGIDVSRHQGNIDWSKVKKDFAIIKITNKGNVVEDKFEQNYKGCIDNNIPIGGYKYVYATTVNEARAEAEGMLKVLNGRKLPYGIWIDMEDKTIRPIGKQLLTDIITTEAKVLQAAGYDVGIYCNYDWWKNVLDSKTLSLKYLFWIARYKKPDFGLYNANWKNNPKSYAFAWQYSSKGKVAGIKGNVDLDVFYGVPGNKRIENTISCPYTKPSVCVTSPANAKAQKFKGKYVSKGKEVGYVQWHLKQWGADLGKYGIDEDCGSKTVSAIKAYQKAHGLKDDGIAGPKTYSVMAK